MTNYNDFDLDMQISQSQNGIRPQSAGLIFTQWDCLPGVTSDCFVTNIATICWECETSDICGDGRKVYFAVPLLLWQLLLIQRNP